AYNGAGPLLTNPDFLVVAGKIVSVEARHAEAIYDLIAPNDAFVDFIDDGLDEALPPMQVLQMAAPFIVTEIDASNLPKA
ncbi:ferritin-like domain-containing protein, partial [Pontibacter toksunensis]